MRTRFGYRSTLPKSSVDTGSAASIEGAKVDRRSGAPAAARRGAWRPRRSAGAQGRPPAKFHGPDRAPRAPTAPCPSAAAPAAAAGLQRPRAATPAPPGLAWLGLSVQHHLPRILRPPRLTLRPISLAQGPPGACGDVAGSALSPDPRPDAGPGVCWRPPRSSGLISSGLPAKAAAAAVNFCGARCSFVHEFSGHPCASRSCCSS